ncbi:AT-rich interactive domain-containing protein 3A-like [Acipenser ruthenus]|uniref:AT-rich interactive domain-containing protein 3A-like n=1 Tax=Acipenser ruthenus TaxID=7906 RepID=UPI0027428C3C|nr:AT-rich interactive domain-containing protein 3A-like [Acipenser ruthenus]XP_058870008.1 AT-rich interactive domain-containing protein 3A-like [Acipenser ruthenus]XP_058870009.1 AT-rich interactive domain-containing protein 3A-like [Acipenser ruthenus]
MKLQAVMENLQRQQRAKLQLQLEQQQQLASQSQAQLSSSANPGTGREEPARGRPGGSPAPEEGSGEQSHTQMAALAAMRAAAAGLQRPPDSPLMEDSSEDEEEGGDEQYKDMMGSEEEEHIKKKWDEEDFEEEMEEDYDDELGEEGVGVVGGASIPGKEAPLHRQLHSHPQLLKAKGAGGQELRIQSLPSQGSLSQTPGQDHGDWTYEEQFKQLYELDGDPKRKEFLDDLFSFMQKRGTPVNRIPIMAKQVLDLYMLYMLVTEKGGLVEVINKKLWREITKGLNLPTSITSAAFTLRTQYMKYLYPYECEKRSLSNPNELQAAIDSNRREGRRQGFGGTLFTYSPNGTPTMLSSPKLPLPSLSRATNGKPPAPTQKIKKEEEGGGSVAGPGRLAGHSMAVQAAAAAAQAAMSAQVAALEQLRDQVEIGEPPEKKMALMADEQQRLMQRALQQNLLAMTTAHVPMNIRINNQESRRDSALNLTTNGTNSIRMSVELNGVVYTGVLFAQAAASSSSVSSHSTGIAGLPVSHTPTSSSNPSP